MLEGQTAAVTGATHGLGRDLALALARAGADIVIIGRDPAAGKEAVQAINAAGRHGRFVAADVGDEAAMDAAAVTAIGSFGQIDILVCAAGVGVPRRPLWESGSADFRTCFDVNVLGVMLALRAFLPGMIARRSGRAVVIGGTYGHKGAADHAIYAASKWAIRGLVKSAALEAGPHNVTVNTIAPGGIDGERLRRLFRQSAEARGESEEAVLARFTSGTALGRLVDSDDIAATLLYLLGDGGRNITGQDIIVDSGTII
jgi:NAD(P)-dependent dehydrogenase (short-subunit alcohol dehydrogenase family)